MSGARVSVQTCLPAAVPELLDASTSVVTGADGSVTLPPPGARGARYAFEKPGLASIAYEAAKALPARVTMPPANEMDGVIVDDRGSSVPNAVIGPVDFAAKCVNGCPDEQRPSLPYTFSRTDATGCFHVSSLPGAKLKFLVVAPGHAPEEVTAEPGQAVSVRLRRAGAAVTGQVVGARDRAPRPAAYVEARRATTRIYAKTDHEGQFAYDGLQPGEWLLRPAAEGVAGDAEPYEAVTITGHAPPKQVTLLADEGVTVGGRVVESDTSKPISGARLSLSGAGPPRSAKSGEGGAFEFKGVGGLSFPILKAEAPGFVMLGDGLSAMDYQQLPCPGGNDMTTVVVLLARGIDVDGAVVGPGGTPQSGAVVTLRATSTAGVRQGRTPAAAEFRFATDSSGLFAGAVTPPGQYEAFATSDELEAPAQKVELWTNCAGVTSAFSSHSGPR